MIKKMAVVAASAALSMVMSMTAWAAVGYVSDGAGGWNFYFNDGSSVASPNTGWVQDTNGWKFVDADSPVDYSITAIDGKLYLFYDGYMRTGWFEGDYGSLNPVTGEWKSTTFNKGTYYFLPDGSGATGWQQIDGKWYYFGPDSILLRYVTTPDGYYVDGNGECTEEGQRLSAELDAIDAALEAEANKTVEEKVQEVIDLTNEEREKRGLAPLERNESLMEAAAIRAEEIAEKFDHTRPNGLRFDSVLSYVGINNGYCGENIAGHGGNAAAVVRGWMNSSGHKKNILNSKYTEIGVGYTEEGGWVQIFIGK